MLYGKSEEIAARCMALVKTGRVRNHVPPNPPSRIHSGEREREEERAYRDFLPGKNCCIAMGLAGHDNTSG